MRIDNSNNYSYRMRNQYTSLTSKKSFENSLANLNKIDMSFFDQDLIDYDKLTKLTLENLSQNYKDVTIYVVNTNDYNDIDKLALGLGNGKHLVVSKDFIEKMGTSAEAYNKGKTILEETLKQLTNSNVDIKSTGAYVDEKGITFWNTYEKVKPLNNNHDNIFDTMKKMQEQVDELRNKFKIIKANSALSAPIDIYSKLARARSIPEVKSVVSTARYKISKLKAMLRDCEDNEKNKIKAAMRQLEKAITRSYRKVRDLSQESNLSHEKTTAEIKDNKKLAEHKRNELYRRRAIRHIRERAQMDEANPLYYYPQILLNKKNNDYKDEPIPTIDIASISIDVAPQIVEVVDTQVNVLPTIEISI